MQCCVLVQPRLVGVTINRLFHTFASQPRLSDFPMLSHVARALFAAVAAAGMSVGLPQCSLAQWNLDSGPESAARRELGKKIIAHRELLKSGVVRVTGVKTLVDPLRTVSRELTIHHTFDFPSRSFVFDYREEVDPRWKDSPIVVRQTSHRSISARSSEMSMQFCNLGARPLLYLDRPTREPRQAHPYEVRSFDIRAIGVCSAESLFRGKSLESCVERLVTSPVKVSSARVYGEPFIAVVMRFADDRAYRRFWVNGDKEYTVFKTEFGYQHRQKDTGEFGTPRRYAGGEVTWELKDNVYVPISYKADWARPFKPTDKERKNGVPEEGDSVRSITLNFQWESVNEPVDISRFDYKTFDLPENTRIVRNP